MEKKNQKVPVNEKLSLPAVWTGLFAAVYVAVLPMAGTIALRNLALLGGLVCLAWQFRAIRSELWLGLPVLLWAMYLLVFPLIAIDHGVAWQNLGGQWGRGLLAMLIGAGTAAVLSGADRRVGVFHLGVLSAVPLLVHLFLFFSKAWEGGVLPWGYWGRETHHADLGYAAGHTVIFLMAAIAAGDRKYRLGAMVLVVAVLLSTVFARSRAGSAFAVFGGVLVLLLAYLKQAPQQRRYTLAGLMVFLLAVAGIGALTLKDDPRWHRMAAELSAGFLGDPIRIECEGVEVIEADIVAQYGAGEQARQLLDSVRYGDGSRMVVLRAGLALSFKYPLGSDGSRQGFQKLLSQECPSPAVIMAHAHNGWIDTLLAIGWLGALLYLLVLLYFLRRGWQSLAGGAGASPWAFVLVAASVFWLVRGLTDSVFRDHMLEMQGFLLAYALVAHRLWTRRWDESRPPEDAS
jgi:drug/metabolite transporter superfamily protein YnfA